MPCRGRSCMVTRAPLFTNKAELFRGARFVVGHDTAIRLVMPKYYSSSEVEMVRQFSRLRARGCRFLVAGRVQQVRMPLPMHGRVLQDLASWIGRGTGFPCILSPWCSIASRCSSIIATSFLASSDRTRQEAKGERSRRLTTWRCQSACAP